MRDRDYLMCHVCGKDIHWEDMEDTIIGFICKECYSDDILRRDLKELERERGILDIDEDLEG